MSWGDFVPTRTLPSMYIITVNIHVDHVLYLGGFCPGGDFVPTTTLPYSMYTITVNTLMDQVLYFGGILSWGDFVPTLILSSLYVSHYGKHFFMISLAWGDFVPTRSLPYPMNTITGNIHIDQVLYFGGFCPGGILSQQQLYLILCTPLQLTII